MKVDAHNLDEGGRRLEGRVALITGAAGGVGAATARLFASEGAKVVLGDTDSVKGAALAQELGDCARFVALDVTSELAWEQFVRIAIEIFGAVNILVSSAGAYRPEPLTSTDSRLVEQMFRVNQLGPIMGMREVVAPMRSAGGGSIVNISSAAGFIGAPGAIAYTASKWALRGATKVAASELAEAKIRVNCIAPGLIETPMAEMNTPEVNASIIAGTPLKRAASPAEIATVCLFLASNESAFVTGAEIVVDGGSILA